MAWRRPKTRPGTWDKSIMESVMRGDEYGKIDFEGKTVLDVGAHIGAFSILAAKCGAQAVDAYEANNANFELLRHNTNHLPQVRAYNAAVWRSDKAAQFLMWHASTERMNTGGGSVIGDADAGETVPAIAFDAAVEKIGGAVDILKLDCEGSEYPILLTTRCLGRIRCIVGEFHPVEVPGWDPVALEEHLVAAGFTTRFTPTRAGQGIFTAERA